MGLPYNEREEQLLSETRKNVKLREQVAALSAQLAKVRERCNREVANDGLGFDKLAQAARTYLAREILATLGMLPPNSPFNGDDDAVLFYEWWSAKGWELFRKWADKQNE